MAHKCKAFVLDCMDFRLLRPLKEWLEKEGLAGDCDEVRVAGSCKSLLSPEKESDRNFLLGQIEKAIRLHHVQEAILINHTDCGAYGGSGHFGSFTEERDFHVEEMRKARELILARYPAIRVRMVLCVIGPTGSIGFEEIK